MTEETERTADIFIGLTADVVSAYVANNAVPTTGLSSLIVQVHDALKRSAGSVAPVKPEVLKPAVPIKRSVTPDYIISLEDGRKFKTLKRHLSAHHGLSPDQYRAKWGLPADYPMVAPNYAAMRSELAKSVSRGNTPIVSEKPAPVKRARKKVSA